MDIDLVYLWVDDKDPTWIEKKNMPATKMGRLWKFKISEVDAWAKAGNAADK